ncbi:hypothetical protein [Actinoplanes sp. CA-252034]|uniref:hypothetical protein n=1 Tax=Actinoplanes sp. CA-252034 TaxID=3239906 RepID=UPI003D9A02A4
MEKVNLLDSTEDVLFPDEMHEDYPKQAVYDIEYVMGTNDFLKAELRFKNSGTR